MKRDHLYLIGDGSGAVKIGRSANPSARVPALQIGNPRALSLLHVIPDAGDLERILHGQFIDLHLRREWFDFGISDPVATVCAAVEDLRRSAMRRRETAADRTRSRMRGDGAFSERREEVLKMARAWAAETRAVDSERDPLVLAMLKDKTFTKEEVHQLTGISRATLDRIVSRATIDRVKTGEPRTDGV